MLSNPSHFAYIILSPVLSTAFALINIGTIYIFYSKFRLSTLPFIVMVNICACDIFVCLASNTFYVTNIVHPVYSWWTGSVACKMFKFLTMLTNISQIYFLCILNADRMRRLVNSTSRQWQKRQGIVFTLIGWFAATIVCVPRLALFEEKMIKKVSPLNNDTTMVSYECKPVGLDDMTYTVVIVFTFIVAYALPACFILYTVGRSQIYMWNRRRQINFSAMSNAMKKLNKKLSLTFNLTGALFMLIWTPFFVLSLVDLNTNIRSQNVNMNFSLRCTLLILGSAKPVIYIICLDKFRQSFSFSRNTNNNATPEVTGSTCMSGKTEATYATNTSMKAEVNCSTYKSGEDEVSCFTYKSGKAKAVARHETDTRRSTAFCDSYL